MSNVIDFEEGMPYKVSEVICAKCGERRIAARPKGTLPRALKCSNHHAGFVIETGEIPGEADA
jgi:hypothetical protein